MGSISDNLKRVATGFTVRDIMVSTADLVCATLDSDAPLVSSACPDFSFIPIKTGQGLSAYYSRDSRLVAQITIQDLISDGTGVLDLVDILELHEFAFVQGPRQIDGFVHFSDLNHHVVKLAFYVLLEGVERYVLDSVRPRLSDDYLIAVLGSNRFEQVHNYYHRARDAGQSVINYLNIADILRLARRAGNLEINEGVISDVKRTRDGAAHSLENLVSNFEDVKKLAEVKRECLRILSAAQIHQRSN
jgi:hypothetical protein